MLILKLSPDDEILSMVASGEWRNFTPEDKDIIIERLVKLLDSAYFDILDRDVDKNAYNTGSERRRIEKQSLCGKYWDIHEEAE